MFDVLGGKDGSKIYFGKPIIYDDDDNIHYMYPNEARLRNMTYGMTIHYDVDVEFIDILSEGEPPSLIVGGESSEIVGGEDDEDYIGGNEEFVDFKTHVNKEDGEGTNNEIKGGMPPKGKKKRQNEMSNHLT